MTPNRRCLLAVLAHPDDEVFPCGGTLAAAALDGIQVILALATGGEEGEVVNPDLRDVVPLTALPVLRQQELACSQRALGIDQVIQLGYRDSGMAGTPANQSPGAFINVPLDSVAERVAGLIRQYRPQVLLTFDETGGYGHPDHIHISRATTLAFDRAGDAGAPWQPLKLYYFAFARDFLRRLQAAYTELGQPLVFGSGMDDRVRQNPEEIGYPDEDIAAIVDIRQTIDRKIDAFRCYRTQVRPTWIYYTAPESVRYDALSREYFLRPHCLVPSPTPEHDLFAGIEAAIERAGS